MVNNNLEIITTFLLPFLSDRQMDVLTDGPTVGKIDLQRFEGWMGRQDRWRNGQTYRSRGGEEQGGGG